MLDVGSDAHIDGSLECPTPRQPDRNRGDMVARIELRENSNRIVPKQRAVELLDRGSRAGRQERMVRDSLRGERGVKLRPDLVVIRVIVDEANERERAMRQCIVRMHPPSSPGGD